jgi:hypothetical protein
LAVRVEVGLKCLQQLDTIILLTDLKQQDLHEVATHIFLHVVVVEKHHSEVPTFS